MRPPRRSRKQLKPFTPNSPPEGLNQVNEAPTFLDARESKACDAYRLVLRPNGWASFGRGTKENWSFIPASLLERYSSSKVFHDGTEGVHYACGWSGLADLLDRYGESYAPSNLEPPSRIADDSSGLLNTQPHSSVKRDEENDDTMTDASQTEPSDNDSDGRGRSKEHGNDEEEEWADEESGATAQVKQEEEKYDDGGIHAAAPDNSSLLTTLECIKLCRQEITWLQENPEFHRPRDVEICKSHMRDTIVNLYSQVSDYNDANGSDSE